MIQWVGSKLRPNEKAVYQIEYRTAGGSYSTLATNVTSTFCIIISHFLREYILINKDLLNNTVAGTTYSARVRGINPDFGYPGSYSSEASLISVGMLCFLILFELLYF